MRLAVSSVIALAIAPNLAAAADFDFIDVRRDDKTWHVTASARIAAGFNAVRAVITDYRHLRWITGAVLESSLLDRPAPGIVAIHVRSRVCLALFCSEFDQVQWVDEREPERIVFEALPQYSDVKRARSEWRLQRIGEEHTQVHWEMLIEPDFWVPPLIGPPLVRAGLEEEGRDMINGIEKLAREREARR